jgi:hypothetical protein
VPDNAGVDGLFSVATSDNHARAHTHVLSNVSAVQRLARRVSFITETGRRCSRPRRRTRAVSSPPDLPPPATI